MNIFSKIKLYIYFQILLIASPVFAISTECDYYTKFDTLVKLANKMMKLDNMYNLTIDELKYIEPEILGKMERMRFNYFDEQGKEFIVYGNPNSIIMPKILVFTQYIDSSIIHSDKANDMPLIRAIAHLITQKDSIFSEFSKRKIDLSIYVDNAGDTINLYLIPTWQTSGYIVNASEYHYKYFLNRSNGIISLIDSVTTTQEALAFKTGADEIVLDYRDLEMPPLGAFMFSLMYNEYFNRIILESKKKKSYLMNILEGSYAHIDK